MKKTNCALHVYLSNPDISPDEAWAISRSSASIGCSDGDPVQGASCVRRSNPHTAIAGHTSVCIGSCSSCCCTFMTMRYLVENYDAAPDILMAFKERFMK